MSNVEDRLSRLLDDVVADPPREVDVVAVRRRATRQRHHLIAATTVAVVLAGGGVAWPLLSHAAPTATESVVSPSRASLSLSPSQGLRPGMRVTVHVHGFPVGVRVFVSQCADAGQVNPSGCGGGPQAITDVHGNVDLPFTLLPEASSAGGGQLVKCVSGCMLMASTGAGEHPVTASVPLDFAEPAPSPVNGSPSRLPFTVLRTVPVHASTRRLVAAGGALFAWGTTGNGSIVVRVDPATGQVGPSTRVDGVSDLAFAGGLLWVARGARGTDNQPVTTPSLLALDPATLAVRHTVPTTDLPGHLAVAGGRLWVAGMHGLTAVDPATGRMVRTVPVDNPGAANGGLIDIAASADGTALWTSEGHPGGGAVPVQLRDPDTGVVLASSPGVGDAVFSAQIAAADDHAWLIYPTGMMATYTGVQRHGDQLVARAPNAREGGASYVNSLQATLIGDRLWLGDGHSITVADASDGTRLAEVPFETADFAVTGLPDGQIALARDSDVLIVQPSVAPPIPVPQPGTYQDARAGLPHYTLTVTGQGRQFTGRIRFIYQDGRTGEDHPYTATMTGPGTFTLSLTGGSSGTGTFRADTVTLDGCGQYLTWANPAAHPGVPPASCTFTHTGP